MLRRAAANRQALGAEKLDAVIEAAVESGASAARLQGLVAAVENLTLQPPTSTDASLLRAILRSADLHHLDELATAAEAALTKLGAP
jgi:hypothetical protein